MAAPSPPAFELSIGEVARRSGVAVSALHFYEAEGLIRGWRSAGNQRRFPRGILRRVAIIKIAQRAGVSLKEIKEALARLPQDRRAHGRTHRIPGAGDQHCRFPVVRGHLSPASAARRPG